MFAETRFVEALRLFLRNYAAHDPEPQRKDGKKVLVVDVKGARFHAAIQRNVFTKLLAGDQQKIGDDIDELVGSRDAANNWRQRFAGHLEELSFHYASQESANHGFNARLHRSEEIRERQND